LYVTDELASYNHKSQKPAKQYRGEPKKVSVIQAMRRPRWILANPFNGLEMTMATPTV
jgi:hypothetical protein